MAASTEDHGEETGQKYLSPRRQGAKAGEESKRWKSAGGGDVGDVEDRAGGCAGRRAAGRLEADRDLTRARQRETLRVVQLQLAATALRHQAERDRRSTLAGQCPQLVS